jgi:hypothetical protein
MDLPFVYRPHESPNVTRTDAAAVPGCVVQFSGCRDDQTAADTFEQGRAGGALTFALSDVLSQNGDVNVEQLLVAMRASMQPHFAQVPQLSCSQPFQSAGRFSFLGAAVADS